MIKTHSDYLNSHWTNMSFKLHAEYTYDEFKIFLYKINSIVHINLLKKKTDFLMTITQQLLF